MDATEAVLREYFSEDYYAVEQGIELLEFWGGYAKTRMKLERKHMNGLRIAHGGAVFGLADFTFAVASNAHGTTAVAIHADISFVKAGKGETLYAEAVEQSRSARLGTYDIRVTDDTGETVALFHGMVYRKPDLIADIVAARKNLPPQ
jgi:acyl-CoA thioesterase